MGSKENTLAGQLIQRLKLLVFFHLGSDATLTFSVTPGGLSVSVGHQRIESFDLQIASQDLAEMADRPEKVEELFLDLLVRYRRG